LKSQELEPSSLTVLLSTPLAGFKGILLLRDGRGMERKGRGEERKQKGRWREAGKGRLHNGCWGDGHPCYCVYM